MPHDLSAPTSDITGAARLHRAASVLMDGLGVIALVSEISDELRSLRLKLFLR